MSRQMHINQTLVSAQLSNALNSAVGHRVVLFVKWATHSLEKSILVTSTSHCMNRYSCQTAGLLENWSKQLASVSWIKSDWVNRRQKWPAFRWCQNWEKIILANNQVKTGPLTHTPRDFCACHCPYRSLMCLELWFGQIILPKCKICSVISNILNFTVAKLACWKYSLFLLQILYRLMVLPLHISLAYATASERMCFLMCVQNSDQWTCISHLQLTG